MSHSIHKFEPEVEFISSNSSSSNTCKSNSENIICHDKLLLDCYTTIVKKKRVYLIAYSSAMQSMHKCTKRCIVIYQNLYWLNQNSHCRLNLKYKLNFRLKLMALEHIS